MDTLSTMVGSDEPGSLPVSGRGRSVIGGLRRRVVAALSVAAACLPCLALGQAAFTQCVAQLERRAVDQGVDAATARRVLGGANKLERVIAADRRQPEFVSTFQDYLDRRVTDERVAQGRQLLAEYRKRLSELTRTYGVPGRYLVALWGLETNYGRVLGNVPVFDSLTTLACDDRRSEYFASELIGALHIVDHGDVDVETMRGSWAGAMGQTQFMPSSYLKYGVDGDGDARVDLWNSVGDAFASAANYLRSLDWHRGERWGREVVLPDGFDYALAGLQRSRPLTEWRELGVEDTHGNPVAELPLEASLLVPAGHLGPAFLVYENFRAIMRWNRSEHFALAVGYLADRVAGSGRLYRSPPATEALKREQLVEVQRLLNANGHDSGTPDGILGPATRAAIREYQAAHGLIADGYVDEALLGSMGIE
jgi:membrane-bound lytic murein transglycosylase B